VAVCDAYAAMVAGRPYRPAMDAERALRELWRAAGTQFDPTVVEAFDAELQSRADPVEISPADQHLATVREVATQIRETLHSS
jgi:HD-GYP domain-containing protein (c-di-GMP phosphodiesterase class II)